MEDKGPTFDIDVIKNSIRDLKEEKLKNEGKLSEVRTKRRVLESKYEAALGKYNQASDTKSKMMDTLKVAQFKVGQSQAAIEHQHKTNEDLGQRIAYIRAEIKTEETHQEQDIELLKAKVASLAETFHNGKDFYGEPSLQTAVGITKTEHQDLASNVQQSETDAERIVGLFEAMELVERQNEMELDWPDIPQELQHQVVDMFEQDRTVEEKELMAATETKRQLLRQLEE